jgi:hypothetical protein
MVIMRVLKVLAYWFAEYQRFKPLCPPFVALTTSPPVGWIEAGRFVLVGWLFFSFEFR